MVTMIKTESEARRLAGDINSLLRVRPFVVVTTPAQSARPYIDPDEIETQVGDLAEVFLIRTGPESWAFSQQMPELTQVYGGAGRAYPVGTDWVHDPYRAPLRFAWGPEEGPKAADLLATDALRMAAEAGLLSKATAGEISEAGTVERLVLPSRALVRTDGRHIASIRQELLHPDVTIDRLLSVGMRVHGSLDPESGRYDVRQMMLPAEEALSAYRPGDVVLAMVEEAAGDHARLRLHPEVEVVVARAEVTSNDLDLVSSLMSPGEVLAVRVLDTGPTWRLSLLDVDDEEAPRPAPSLLRGGPPWLLPPVATEPEQVADEVTAAELAAPDTLTEPPEAPAPDTAPPPPAVRPTPRLLDRRPQQGGAPAVAAEIEGLRRELAAVRAELGSATARIETLHQALRDVGGERQLLHNQLERAKARADRLDQQLKQSKTELRKARQKAPRKNADGRGDGAVFPDDEEQFRFEVLVAWAQRIPAADKADLPLRDYRFGPDFLPTVVSVPGIDRRKLVDVTVEVLTGLAERLDGRDMHQLRTGDGGGDPPVVRDDGATCWRVALQVSTPAARRLHFWRVSDGSIELSRVALHDDFRP